MRIKLILSILAIVLLVISCFLPWMTIETKAITISGVNTEPTKFGRPGYFHFLWAGLYLIFLMVNKLWSQRTAVGLAAFNIAWALRNFLLIPACAGGECPTKRAGLYLLLIASFAMFLIPLLTKTVEPDRRAN